MLFQKAPEEIGLYYYKCANAGDMLNEILIDRLFHIRTKEENFGKSDMIAVGSVMERIVRGVPATEYIKKVQSVADKTRTLHVWGTGFIRAYEDFSDMEFIRPVHICAVRGELTKKAIEKITGQPLSCVTADPGILAPLLLKQLPEKKYTLGIIPHVIEREAEAYKSISERQPGSAVIDLTAHPVDVLNKIAACETVISTSLHGLIFADALGIPSRWCELTDKILGNGFKYRDYYSAFGIEETAFDLKGGEFPTPEEIKQNYKVKIKDVKKKQKELIQCFPYRGARANAYLEFIKKSFR